MAVNVFSLKFAIGRFGGSIGFWPLTGIIIISSAVLWLSSSLLPVKFIPSLLWFFCFGGLLKKYAGIKSYWAVAGIYLVYIFCLLLCTFAVCGVVALMAAGC